MEEKTILIAETNKQQDKLIRDALIKNNVNVKILDEDPINSEEMKAIIISLKPDIIITNERKKDKPASDVICEIQKDKDAKQPIFILVSGYQKVDMEYTINYKGINVYTIYKPYDFDDLTNYVKDLVENSFENEETKDDFYEKWKKNIIIRNILKLKIFNRIRF